MHSSSRNPNSYIDFIAYTTKHKIIKIKEIKWNKSLKLTLNKADDWLFVDSVKNKIESQCGYFELTFFTSRYYKLHE